VNSTRRWLLSLAVGAFCAGGVGALVGFAQRTPAPVDEIQELVAEPAVSIPNPLQSPRSARIVSWPELRDGECLSDFQSVSQESFTLVDCEGPHKAEFVRATVIDGSLEASYPGDEAVREFAAAHCAQWQGNDLSGGEAYDDLVVVPAYPLGASAWKAGDRLVGCVVYRAGGGLLTSQLVR
jgi:hypothetical protein